MQKIQELKHKLSETPDWIERYIDRGIQDLIKEVNLHPEFVTTSSCAGHLHFMQPQNLLKTADDLDLHYWEMTCRASYDYENPSELQTGTAPFLYFMCTPTFQPMIDYLSSLNKSFAFGTPKVYFTTPQPPNEDEFHYSFHDDEGLPHKREWSSLGFKDFETFWNDFSDGWKKVTGYGLTIPTSFPLNRPYTYSKYDVINLGEKLVWNRSITFTEKYPEDYEYYIDSRPSSAN